MKNVMAWVNKNGLTDLNTKVNGATARLTDKESCSTQMATSMKVSGLTIRQMESELTHMLMELNTSDSGETISNMDRALKRGLMELYMMANTLRAKRMGRAS